MGGLLDKPNVAKQEFDGEFSSSNGLRIKYGGSCMQGWRKYQEDTFSVCSQFFDITGILILSVFDGHGGKQTSQYCKHHFNDFLYNRIEANSFIINESLIQSAFLDFDKKLPVHAKDHVECGCTGTVCIVDANMLKLFVAHIGDSRALVFNPRTRQTIHETRDHNPTDPLEQQRISSRSGQQVRQGRIWSQERFSLNVCRCFGDRNFKRFPRLPYLNQPVIAKPEYYEKSLLGPPVCVCLASDGIWNGRFPQAVKSVPSVSDINDQMVSWCINDTLTRARNEGIKYSASMSRALDHVMAKVGPSNRPIPASCGTTGSTDNMTAIFLLIVAPPKKNNHRIPKRLGASASRNAGHNTKPTFVTPSSRNAFSGSSFKVGIAGVKSPPTKASPSQPQMNTSTHKVRNANFSNLYATGPPLRRIMADSQMNMASESKGTENEPNMMNRSMVIDNSSSSRRDLHLSSHPSEEYMSQLNNIATRSLDLNKTISSTFSSASSSASSRNSRLDLSQDSSQSSHLLTELAKLDVEQLLTNAPGEKNPEMSHKRSAHSNSNRIRSAGVNRSKPSASSQHSGYNRRRSMGDQSFQSYNQSNRSSSTQLQQYNHDNGHKLTASDDSLDRKFVSQYVDANSCDARYQSFTTPSDLDMDRFDNNKSYSSRTELDTTATYSTDGGEFLKSHLNLSSSSASSSSYPHSNSNIGADSSFTRFYELQLQQKRNNEHHKAQLNIFRSSNDRTPTSPSSCSTRWNSDGDQPSAIASTQYARSSDRNSSKLKLHGTFGRGGNIKDTTITPRNVHTADSSQRSASSSSSAEAAGSSGDIGEIPSPLSAAVTATQQLRSSFHRDLSFMDRTNKISAYCSTHDDTAMSFSKQGTRNNGGSSGGAAGTIARKGRADGGNVMSNSRSASQIISIAQTTPYHPQPLSTTLDGSSSSSSLRQFSSSDQSRGYVDLAEAYVQPSSQYLSFSQSSSSSNPHAFGLAQTLPDSGNASRSYRNARQQRPETSHVNRQGQYADSRPHSHQSTRGRHQERTCNGSYSHSSSSYSQQTQQQQPQQNLSFGSHDNTSMSSFQRTRLLSMNSFPQNNPGSMGRVRVSPKHYKQVQYDSRDRGTKSSSSHSHLNKGNTRLHSSSSSSSSKNSKPKSSKSNNSRTSSSMSSENYGHNSRQYSRTSTGRPLPRAANGFLDSLR